MSRIENLEGPQMQVNAQGNWCVSVASKAPGSYPVAVQERLSNLEHHVGVSTGELSRNRRSSNERQFHLNKPRCKDFYVLFIFLFVGTFGAPKIENTTMWQNLYEKEWNNSKTSLDKV